MICFTLNCASDPDPGGSCVCITKLVIWRYEAEMAGHDSVCGGFLLPAGARALLLAGALRNILLLCWIGLSLFYVWGNQYLLNEPVWGEMRAAFPVCWVSQAVPAAVLSQGSTGSDLHPCIEPFATINDSVCRHQVSSTSLFGKTRAFCIFLP